MHTAFTDHMSSVGWIVATLVELVLFLMVLRKIRQVKRRYVYQTSSLLSERHRPRIRDITTILARDSAIYFAMWVL